MASVAQQYSGLRCSPLSSSLLSKPLSSKPLKSVCFPIVSAVAITGNAETRERHRMKEMFEEAYERCRTAPTEGISFTVEDFHNALDKYDFNSEIGTKFVSDVCVSRLMDKLLKKPTKIPQIGDIVASIKIEIELRGLKEHLVTNPMGVEG